MIRRLALTAALLAAVTMLLVGCEGEQGPAGEQGPPGEDLTQSDYTYIGGEGEACLHCHARTVADWFTTGHQQAYTDLAASPGAQTNLYCLSCHTTGFDSEVVYGDTEIAEANRGPNTDGYDDYFGVDTQEAAERRAALEGVQCEGCHGPMGPDARTVHARISFATRYEGEGEDRVSLSLCSPCHHNQLDEWAESGHGMRGQMTIEEFNGEHYAHNASCVACHTSEGFIAANDPAYADYEFDHEVSFIGCVTCHDPHVGAAGGGNEGQLRQVGAVYVEFDPYEDDDQIDTPAMEGYGAAQTCAQCHHGRRDNDNVNDQITLGDSHFGPHESPQMDMFIGAGSYEIPGYSYTREFGHQSQIGNACVGCHMNFSQDGPVHRVHNFEPSLGFCQAVCHSSATDFDIGDVQTDTQQKMDDLAAALGFADAAAFLDESTGFDSEAAGVQVYEREAAYALAFVASDGSLGIHNPRYAFDLLDNALDHVNSMAGKRTPGR